MSNGASSNGNGHSAPLSAAEGVGESEEAKRERDRQLVEVLRENFPEGVVYQFVVMADGRRLLTFLGSGAERIFGERPEKMPVELSWLSSWILASDEPGITEAGERSLRELTRFNHDVRIRTREGVQRWVSFRSQPREPSGGHVVWDGMIIDVTSRHRAEESIRRQADFLAALNQTTLELLGRRKVPDLLSALAERAAALLNSPHAEISLLEGDELVVRAFSKGHEYLSGDRVRRGSPALSWRAIDSRQPVVADRYAEHPESRTMYHQYPVYAAAVFPILRGDECVGVLGVGREQPHAPFSEDDLQEGKLLAQMAALVLHNAAIHEEAVREAEARTVALRESEERFRAVFDQSPIMIMLASMPDARIREINTSGLKALGFAREEVVGRTSPEIGLWASPADRERYLEQLLGQGFVTGFEATMRRKHGESFCGILSGCLMTIAGQPYTLNSIQDITARKQSEAARDRSLALMRATLESTADGILVVNGDGRIETWNLNFAEMWGVPAPGAPGAEEEAILPVIIGQLADPEKFLASVLDLYAESEDEVFDVLHCKDGRILERFSRPQLLGGRPVGRVWSFRDITDARSAEAALRASEERFRVLAEVSPVGIFSTDTAGKTTFVNKRWTELADLPAEEALGDGWMVRLHPEDRTRVAAAWSEAVRAGESSAAEYRFVRPDGSTVWLVGSSRAQRAADGQLSGYVGTITDVTSLKRAEADRQKIEAQLRQSRKMESLGTLAGGIAHDFNNILNGTFGFVDLARLDLQPGHPAHAWLDQISVSSQRARELVRQILTFSRKNEGERSPQHLQAVVEEAVRLLRSTLPAMVELDVRLAPDTPPVLADATQIHQVVLNLCANAAHAILPKGGHVGVILEPCPVTPAQAEAQPDLRPGLWARLTVADNGCGMDAATLEHIFEPFFTTRETGVGTGLGLAVVHGIVKSHQGAIFVRSAPGVGSTFEIYLPAVAAGAVRAPAVNAAAPRGHGERLLVVDDDPVSGFAIEKMLASLNYTVTRCTRPEDALTRFAAAPANFDLVVSDLAMPGMNGEELIGHLARIRPDLPIIVVSGFVETARQRILEKNAARAVLRKPVSRDELGRAVAQHLGDRT